MCLFGREEEPAEFRHDEKVQRREGVKREEGPLIARKRNKEKGDIDPKKIGGGRGK